MRLLLQSKRGYSAISRQWVLVTFLLLCGTVGCKPGNQRTAVERTCYLFDGTGLKILPDHPIRYQGREIGHVKNLAIAKNPRSTQWDIEILLTLDQAPLQSIFQPVFYFRIDPQTGGTLLEVLPASQMPADTSQLRILDMP